MIRFKMIHLQKFRLKITVFCLMEIISKNYVKNFHLFQISYVKNAKTMYLLTKKNLAFETVPVDS